MTNKLIGVMIFLVIGLALLPVANSFADDLTKGAVTDTLGSTVSTAGAFYNTNTGTLIDLLPLIYVILLVVGVIGYVRISRN